MEDDNNNGLNIDLLEFNSVYGISAVFYDYDYNLSLGNSWQVRFNEDIYDWTSVTFSYGISFVLIRRPGILLIIYRLLGQVL